MTTALSDAAIASVVKSAGWTGNDVPIAIAIVLAESGGRPDAVNDKNSNGSSDYGLFQINSIHTAILASGNRFDPNDNARMAMRVFKDAGSKWTPWSTYNSRRYAMFLPRANAVAGSNVPADNPSSASSGGTGQFAHVTSLETWTRVGMFVAGAVLLLIFALAVLNKTGVSNLVPVARAARALKTVKKAA